MLFRSGFSWMYRNSRIGFGSIIADDMGLGKTMQVITLLLKYKEEKAIDAKHKALIPAGRPVRSVSPPQKYLRRLPDRPPDLRALLFQSGGAAKRRAAL